MTQRDWRNEGVFAVCLTFRELCFPCTVTVTASDEIRVRGVAILVAVPFSSFAAQTR